MRSRDRRGCFCSTGQKNALATLLQRTIPFKNQGSPRIVCWLEISPLPLHPPHILPGTPSTISAISDLWWLGNIKHTSARMQAQNRSFCQTQAVRKVDACCVAICPAFFDAATVFIVRDLCEQLTSRFFNSSKRQLLLSYIWTTRSVNPVQITHTFRLKLKIFESVSKIPPWLCLIWDFKVNTL